MQIMAHEARRQQQEQITTTASITGLHIFPRWKWFVFLSFLPEETPAGIHPPYKHVYIRLLPIDGKGTPKCWPMFMAGRALSTHRPGRRTERRCVYQ